MILNEDQERSVEALSVLHGDCTVRVEEATKKYHRATIVEKVDERPGLHLGHYRLFQNGNVRDEVNEETITADELQRRAYEPEISHGRAFSGLGGTDPIAFYNGGTEED